MTLRQHDTAITTWVSTAPSFFTAMIPVHVPSLFLASPSPCSLLPRKEALGVTQ